MDKLIKEQNKYLIGLIEILAAMLPRHASSCYGLKVHPSNREEYCNCKMDEVRERVSKLILSSEKAALEAEDKETK